MRWNEAHIFADQHNITLVGGEDHSLLPLVQHLIAHEGSDKSVGAVGGWLQGGGHGALSNTMGMGADRVVRYPHLLERSKSDLIYDETHSSNLKSSPPTATYVPPTNAKTPTSSGHSAEVSPSSSLFTHFPPTPTH